MKVLVLGNEPIVLGGIVALVADDPRFDTVDTAENTVEADTLIRAIEPNVVVIHADRVEPELLAWMRRQRDIASGTAMVMISRWPRRDVVLDTLRAGVSGFLVLGNEPRALCDAICEAGSGGAPIDSRAARFVLDHMAGRDRQADLTRRERDVLVLLASGMLNKQIARQLDISTATVKAHLTRVYERLGVRDRTQAAMWAVANGLVPDEQEPLVGLSA